LRPSPAPKALPRGAVPLVVASHVTRIYGPVQALVAVLKGWDARFRLISLPFAGSGIPDATDELQDGPAVTQSHRGHAARGPALLLWPRDLAYALRRGWAASREGRVPLWIGINCLNAWAGLLLKSMGRVDRVVYYVIDYTPRRFGNPLLNWAYHWVERRAALGADQVWNLSEAMRKVHAGLGVPERRNTLVPVGVELDKVRPAPRAKVRRKTLVYMGALQRNKGVQLLIEALPAVRAKVPGAELHVIGYGDFEAELRGLAKASPAAKAIKFHGAWDHDRLFRELPSYGVALATYLEDADSYTRWADPTKPKEYLACGLPLIITKVPWIWERVADTKAPMGVAIHYDKAQLVAAAVKLLGDDRFYWRCRRNALAFAATLDWEDIYERAFGAETGR
jgi:glycosyltransferase involved in cell wall biosynthesis